MMYENVYIIIVERLTYLLLLRLSCAFCYLNRTFKWFARCFNQIKNGLWNGRIDTVDMEETRTLPVSVSIAFFTVAPLKSLAGQLLNKVQHCLFNSWHRVYNNMPVINMAVNFSVFFTLFNCDIRNSAYQIHIKLLSVG
jgi:hypothetical protein